MTATMPLRARFLPTLRYIPEKSLSPKTQVPPWAKITTPVASAGTTRSPSSTGPRAGMRTSRLWNTSPIASSSADAQNPVG